MKEQNITEHKKLVYLPPEKVKRICANCPINGREKISHPVSPDGGTYYIRCTGPVNARTLYLRAEISGRTYTGLTRQSDYLNEIGVQEWAKGDFAEAMYQNANCQNDRTNRNGILWKYLKRFL